MNTLIRAALVLSLTGLVGCSPGNPYRINDVISRDTTNRTAEELESTWVVEHYGGTSVTEMINPETYVAPEQRKPDGDGRPLFHMVYKSGAPAKDRELARNRLQMKILELSDKEASGHLSRITGTQVTINVVTGSAALVTTGLAAVNVGGAATKLAQASTGILGFKSLLNEEIFRNLLADAVVNTIVAHRLEFYERIKVRQTETIANYTMEEAIRDANEYHLRGSFFWGLAELSRLVEQQNSDVQNKITKSIIRQDEIKRINAAKK